MMVSYRSAEQIVELIEIWDLEAGGLGRMAWVPSKYHVVRSMSGLASDGYLGATEPHVEPHVAYPWGDTWAIWHCWGVLCTWY